MYINGISIYKCFGLYGKRRLFQRWTTDKAVTLFRTERPDDTSKSVPMSEVEKINV